MALGQGPSPAQLLFCQTIAAQSSRPEAVWQGQRGRSLSLGAAECRCTAQSYPGKGQGPERRCAHHVLLGAAASEGSASISTDVSCSSTSVDPGDDSKQSLLFPRTVSQCAHRECCACMCCNCSLLVACRRLPVPYSASQQMRLSPPCPPAPSLVSARQTWRSPPSLVSRCLSTSPSNRLPSARASWYLLGTPTHRGTQPHHARQ